MNLSDSIGGYFELELTNNSTLYHDNAVALNSGRNALEYILLVNNYDKIYLPYFTCDVTLQPIKKLNIDFEFYFLDENFYPKLKAIRDNEALLFVNYFGLFENNISFLKNKYYNLIVDNAQAFFAKPHKTVPTLYSPRKFFGLPDGGFVYSDKKLRKKLEFDKSANRISHLIARIEEGAETGYELFQQNDNKLNDLPLRMMSKLTKKLLRNIDFEAIRVKRNENFNMLHQALNNKNELSPNIENSNIDGPMVYPFLKKGNKLLREKLIKEKIFVAKYWPNVYDWINRKDVFEKYLVDNLIPLPVDQRYGNRDITKIINLIIK